MALDLKYGQVTLEHGDVGEDEPVIVFRCKDALLPALLSTYYVLCRAAGSPERHLALIEANEIRARSWQSEHGHRVPTSESSRAWLST